MVGIHLEEVAGDETAQAVADHVHLGCSGGEAERFDRAPEVAGETLVVDTGPVGEAGEVSDAARTQVSPQEEEVGRVAEEAVHEDDRRRVRGGRIEALTRHYE